MVKKALSSGARAVLATVIVIGALTMALLGGCSDGIQTETGGKAIPEVAVPIEPVAGVEPMQSLGGEETAGEDE